MTDQRSFSRTLIATALAVLACCGLAVTIKVLAGSPIAVQSPRVLDQGALERHVINAVEYGARKTSTKDDVTCPASVAVEAGRKFECDVRVDGTSKIVEVEIKDDQGDLTATTPE
ncbi:DUF4333 domain-containing protein [Streptomyces sp. NPDC058297]|uniref:DUF4333 domain-containing protein n=1 Tax=Streptomyces sp. NPDC058297 TaxID=3346433 RepID=UPI0036E3B833